MFSGCTNKAVYEDVSLTEFLDESKNVNEKVDRELQNFLFKHLNSKKEKKCNVIKIKSEDDDSFQNYCTELIHFQKIEELLFIAVGGRKVDENLESMDSHADSGIIRLIVVSKSNNNFSIIAETKYLVHGNYGAPPSNIKVTKLGLKKAYAWVIGEGTIQQGYSSEFLSVYLFNNQEIHNVLSVQFSTDNEGACGDDSSLCVYETEKINLAIKTNDVDLIFPLQVEKNHSIGSGNDKKSSHELCTVEFDNKNKIYTIPKKCLPTGS